MLLVRLSRWELSISEISAQAQGLGRRSRTERQSLLKASAAEEEDVEETLLSRPRAVRPENMPLNCHWPIPRARAFRLASADPERRELRQVQADQAGTLRRRSEPSSPLTAGRVVTVLHRALRQAERAAPTLFTSTAEQAVLRLPTRLSLRRAALRGR